MCFDKNGSYARTVRGGGGKLGSGFLGVNREISGIFQLVRFCVVGGD